MMAPLVHAALWAVWIGLHHDAVAWLAAHYGGADRRVEAGLLVIVALAALVRLRQTPPDLRGLRTWPRPAPLPLFTLAVATALGSLAPSLHIAGAAALLLGVWALVGLVVPPRTWAATSPWLALVLVTLPLGPFADVYLGFPTRLATARAVATALGWVGVPGVGADTVLLLDRPGGVSALDVGAPCAGVRSVWTLGLLALGVVIVERRRVDRWFVAALTTGVAAMLVLNTMRVGTIVVLHAVADVPRLAAALHTPLGLTGFALAALVCLGMLRRAGPLPGSMPERRAPSVVLAPALLAAMFVAAALTRPAVAASPARPLALAFQPAAELHAVGIGPTPAELRFFGSIGEAPPHKWRITAGERAGSLLVLPSRAWRAHHLPEACLLSQGRVVAGSWTVALAPDFPVRVARVDDRATSLSWFQAPDRVTDDLATRTWAALRGDEDRWVLVSLLLDGVVARTSGEPGAPIDPAVARLLVDLREEVAAAFALEPG